MNSPLTLFILGLTLVSFPVVSSAQDAGCQQERRTEDTALAPQEGDPAPPPKFEAPKLKPPNPAPEDAEKVVADPPAPAKSDPAALKLLATAASRQGGASLAKPGGLESFFVEFGRIRVWRWSKGDDGKWNGLPEEVSKMNISWMRHAGKPSSLRTFWELNGRQVTRAVSGRNDDYHWLDDGSQVSAITKETHPDDYAEVESHRRLSEALIDVAVLAKLQNDGSIWKLSADTTFAGRALRRTPSASTGGLTFTMWLDEKTGDPRHIRVEPVDESAPLMIYEFTYQDDLSKEIFSVAGAKLRFPRQVVVEEQYKGTPKHKVMHLYVRRVAFNAVDEKAAFAPPKRSR